MRLDVKNTFIAAIKGKKTDVVKSLLESKQVDVSTESAGFYPLHEAVTVDSPEIVELLLAHGASHFHQNNDKETAIRFAAKNNKWDCVLKFAQYKADKDNNDGYSNALLYAVTQKRKDVVEALLKAGAPPSIGYYIQTENSSLHQAVQANSPEILDLLLRYGGDYSSEKKNKEGRSPANLAGNLMRFDCIRVFAKYSPKKDPVGYSLLLLRAVSAKEYQIAFDLLSAGAPTTYAYSNTKATPLHEAVHNNNPHLVSLLVHHYQADTSVINQYGKTPLDLATELAQKTGIWDCVLAFTDKSPAFLAEQFCKALLRGEAAEPSRIDKKEVLNALRKIAAQEDKSQSVFTLLESALNDAEENFKNKTETTLPLAKLIRQPRKFGTPQPGEGQWLEFTRLCESLKPQEVEIAKLWTELFTLVEEKSDLSIVRKKFDALMNFIEKDKGLLESMAPAIVELLGNKSLYSIRHSDYSYMSNRLTDLETNYADKQRKLLEKERREIEEQEKSFVKKLPPTEPAATPTANEEKTESAPRPASPSTTAAITQALPVVETETPVEEKPAEPASPAATVEPAVDPMVITIPSPRSSKPAEFVSLPEPAAEEKQSSPKGAVGLFTPGKITGANTQKLVEKFDPSRKKPETETPYRPAQ